MIRLSSPSARKQIVTLVAKARGVEKRPSSVSRSASAPTSSLSSRAAQSSGASPGDVLFSRRKLEQGLVDRPAVLADAKDVGAVVLERHDAHGVEGPHDLALEGEAVRTDEGADDHTQSLT